MRQKGSGLVFEGVLDFTGHEGVRVPLEKAQAGQGAEVIALSAVYRTGMIARILEGTSAGGPVGGRSLRRGLSQGRVSFDAAHSIFPSWLSTGRPGQTP